MPLRGLPEETILVLIVTLIVFILTVWYDTRVRAGHRPFRRPLAAFDVIWAALGRGAETGRVIHLSPGAGTVGNRVTTAETMIGLLAAERIATEAAFNGAAILVSSGDAVSHLALRGIVRQAYYRSGQSQIFNAASVQLLAHQDPMAYASGVSTLYERQRLEASQLIGSFGQELLLVGETGAQRDLPQMMGTTTPVGLPLMFLSTRSVLIGEEVFAADAYLATVPDPQARLMTQDFLRTILILVIVLGIIYSLIQPVVGLPPLPGI